MLLVFQLLCPLYACFITTTGAEEEMPSTNRRPNAAQSSNRAARSNDQQNVDARQRERVQRTYGGRSQRSPDAAQSNGGGRHRRVAQPGENEDDAVQEEDDENVDGDDNSVGEEGGDNLWGLSYKPQQLPVSEAMKGKAAQFEKEVSILKINFSVIITCSDHFKVYRISSAKRMTLLDWLSSANKGDSL